MFGDGDVAVVTAKPAEEFVVVPRNIDYARAFAGFAKEFLNDIVMRLGPVNAAPHLPDVDQVADDIQSLELVRPKEFEKRGGVAIACAEMNVGDPTGPKMVDIGRSHHAEISSSRNQVRGVHMGVMARRDNSRGVYTEPKAVLLRLCGKAVESR